jgi:hypothetical protein
VGINSGISGNPAKLLIIDDPIKSWQEANSFTYRERVWSWYLSEARTRVHPGGSIILVLTRWNEDDLAGRLIKRGPENWEVINLPAIYDRKAEAFGPDPLDRSVGESLWPTRYTVRELEAFQGSMEVWESLYQGRPGTTAGLGNTYYAFREPIHVKAMDRDPMQRLVWSLDFNVDPMCSVICQYQEIGNNLFLPSGATWTHIDVLDEICLGESNTVEACNAFLARAQQLCHNQDVLLEIYGDPAGNSRHTSQVSGSDWDIIKRFFRGRGQFTVHMKVGKQHPRIKDRTNAVNTMLQTASGEVRTAIHPRCKMLIRDLLNVKWKKDLSGNTTGTLDKSQKDLTHVSDAWGYFVERRFGKNRNTGDTVSDILR